MTAIREWRKFKFFKEKENEKNHQILNVGTFAAYASDHGIAQLYLLF